MIDRTRLGRQATTLHAPPHSDVEVLVLARPQRAGHLTERQVEQHLERSLAEFFAEIEDGTGPSLTADDHRALVARGRSDRERPNDG